MVTADRNTRSRGRLPGEPALEQHFQADAGLMLPAQHEQVRAAAQARAQRRAFAADLARALGSPIEPQVQLPIELELQVMRERVLGGIVTGAANGAIARPAGGLPVYHDRVPLAGIRAIFTFSRGKHTAHCIPSARGAFAFRRTAVPACASAPFALLPTRILAA
jgi:hypothetical protein